MKKITKAIFPVAGMGTRMLPATKATPKELLPVFTTPILDLLVSECHDAGIEEIILITSREKFLIESYFDSFPELEKKLARKGDTNRLAIIQKFKSMKISCVRQGEPKGDGHAILCAEHLLGDESFLVVFGDELTFGEPNSITQLLNAYEQKQSSVIGVRKVPMSDVSSYGVVEPKEQGAIFEIAGIQEKPKKADAKSDMAVIGKYICTSSIWKALHNSTESDGGEIRLADGFAELVKTEKISACTISGERFDTGSPKGYALANLYYALASKGITKEDVHEILEKI